MTPPLSWRGTEPAAAAAERLHCRGVLRLKAVAVVAILAAKCGHEAFLAIVRGLIQAAIGSRTPPDAAAGAGARGSSDGAGDAAAAAARPAWRLETASFLKQVAQVGGFRREINAFAERWIYGSGCPRIHGAPLLDPSRLRPFSSRPPALLGTSSTSSTSS